MSDAASARFRRLIASTGPISVARFMAESNALYYTSRDPLGATGDFITAPEISQMFGELIGLWLADVWHSAGRPADAIYAELGPGRGTLAADALRAMKGADLRPHVHLVEASPVLREAQAAVLPGAHFHDDPATLPDDRPLLVVANEFLDALPVRQLVMTDTGWRERTVELDGDAFHFATGAIPLDALIPSLARGCAIGDIVEINPGAAAVVAEIAQRIAKQGGVALIVDYGHLASRTGSTLQAVRGHRKVDPLAHPGEADLTAHVDFVPLADIARHAGCAVTTATQGEWLRELGIDQRAATLARGAPARCAEIFAARDRLVQAGEMGELFKVMGIVAPGWPAVSGFGR